MFADSLVGNVNISSPAIIALSILEYRGRVRGAAEDVCSDWRWIGLFVCIDKIVPFLSVPYLVVIITAG